MSGMISYVTGTHHWCDLDLQKFEEMNKICKKFELKLTDDTYLLINITTQRLHLIASKTLANSYPVSTAKNGIGQKEGTGQTPLGLHFVAEKIGDGARPFEIFKSRVSTGEIAKANDGAMIVGRILWLRGAEPGFNQGKDSEGNVVDTYQRYIYIHGTNDIANIGNAVSAGCIRLNPDDAVDLFQRVPEKTPVYIYHA